MNLSANSSLIYQNMEPGRHYTLVTIRHIPLNNEKFSKKVHLETNAKNEFENVKGQNQHKEATFVTFLVLQ